MAEGKRPATPDTSRRWLWSICGLAVAARVAGALYQGNQVEPLPGIWDQISYHTLAIRVLGGHGFTFGTGWWPATPAGEPTAHWSFAYVLVLALAYLVFGPNPIAARLVQAVLAGVLQPLLAFRIGKRMFGPRTGLIAAALAAVNGYFVYYSSALMTESLYVVALLWAIDIATAIACQASKGQRAAPVRLWILLGLAFAAAVHLRQVAVLLVPGVLGWLVWGGSTSTPTAGARARRPRLVAFRGALVSAAVILASVLPFTLRNYRAFGTFVLLNTNAGFAFYWANHPVHGDRFIPLLAEDKPSYGDLIPAELKSLNEGRLDRTLLSRGLAIVGSDPWRYLRLSMSRSREYFKFWPEAGSSALSNWTRVLSFGLLLPLILMGLILSMFRREWLVERTEYSKSAGRFVLLTAGTYVLIHLLSWTLVRYRLPVDAMLLPFAAAAVLVVRERLGFPSLGGEGVVGLGKMPHRMLSKRVP